MVQHIGNIVLVDKIVEQINDTPNKSISFHQFMSMCLYYPELGYYTNNKSKIGKEGDFYTSSSIGSIMGEMLALTFVKILRERFKADEPIYLVEWGSGTGQLAKDLLDEIHLEYPEIYQRIQYTSVEESDYHILLQKEKLADHLKIIQWKSAEKWYEQGNNVNTIIYSNELLDAFPVHRIQYMDQAYYELYVVWDEQNEYFSEKPVLLEQGPLLSYIAEEGISLEEGQRAEVNLQASEWIRRTGKWLDQGVILTIDYGDVVNEIYAKHRMNGTLMCYRNHQAYDNPYIYVGEQDITTHVNFSSCIRSGIMAGLNEWSLLDQKTFLIEAGIMEKLQSHEISDPFHPTVKKNRAIRQILLSDQMSELFKVLIQSKGYG